MPAGPFGQVGGPPASQDRLRGLHGPSGGRAVVTLRPVATDPGHGGLAVDQAQELYGHVHVGDQGSAIRRRDHRDQGVDIGIGGRTTDVTGGDAGFDFSAQLLEVAGDLLLTLLPGIVGPLPNPVNGRVSFPGVTTYGATAEYTCTAGY